MARIFLITSLVVTSFFGFADVAKADACSDAYDLCEKVVKAECEKVTGEPKQACLDAALAMCDNDLIKCETAAAGAAKNSGGGPAGAGTAGDKYGLKQTANEAQLPNIDKDLPEIVGIIIAALLGLVATVFFALMVYGGFLWMTAAGNGEQVGQAKKLIMNAVLGIIVMSAAYAITNFVINAIS